ncbi:hypothetical protein CSC28_4334 [Pseudomonas paraeruginosa]|nr:hypothetical protein CSC28_4334 [Pseudomonas paraeruginosa]
MNASTSRSITARTPACLLAPAVDGKPEDQPFKGYEICVFPDALDTGANLEIGYMPGPLPWLVTASWPPSPSSKRSPADPPSVPRHARRGTLPFVLASSNLNHPRAASSSRKGIGHRRAPAGERRIDDCTERKL